MISTFRATRFRPSLRLALGAVARVLGLTAPPISAQGARPPAIQLRGAENLGIGTSRSKAAMARGGDDVIRGNRGNDLICGGSGNDRLFGGRRSDNLWIPAKMC
jgi:hypothetical protein